MTDEEKRLFDSVVNTDELNRTLFLKMARTSGIVFVIIAICFTISMVSVSVATANTMQECVHDYFYSDYDYGSIEQSVTQHVGQEVKK